MSIKISKHDLNFLDITILKDICNKYKIDYNIYIELENNKIKKISDKNSKSIIIKDILNYIKTNNIPKPTIYKRYIQNYNSTENIKENDYIYYGQYKTTDKNILILLKSLTKNLFKFGAISQKIIKKYFKKNKLITYKEFANLWLNEYKKGNIKFEELAYNQFMKKYGNKEKWFLYKNNIINKIKKLLKI